MKRNFVGSLFGSLVGFGLLLVLLSVVSSVGAQSGDVQSSVSRPYEVSASTPLTSTFTYQGQLKNSGTAVNGSCQMAFRLYDALSSGNLIGSPITTTVTVANGLFTVGLNFGSSAFDASGRWLDVRVNCGGGFTQLTPRQALTPVPYALAFGAPGSVSGYMVSGASPGPYPTLGFNTTGFPYLAGAAGYGGVLQFQNGNGALWYATGTNVAAGAAHTMTPRLAIDANGNVGIGTTTPAHHLSVIGGPPWTNNGWLGALEISDASAIGWQANASGQRFGFGHAGGGFYFFHTASDPGTTANPAIYDMLIANGGNVGIGTVNPTAKLDVNGDIQGTSFSAAAGMFLNAWTGRIALRVANGGQIPAERLTILANGNVGIGTTTPAATLDVEGLLGVGGQLYVKGTDNSPGTVAFEAQGIIGNNLVVYNDGGVGILPWLQDNTTEHWCRKYRSAGNSSSYTFNGCSSAAEYVPTIDSGSGFPETADLVSIVPAIKNPYGDTHGPFVVAKSTQACNDNLLGFIVKPESGADGTKINEHYLPLAIYGYFPAKVTLENGAIKRGDPLTSSSKPGYGMKATQACKIIGYALEDADHEGTIQVFANHGESTVPAVTALQAQVKELKDQNAALDARLTALEKTMGGQTPAQSLPAPLDKRGTP